MERYSLMIKGSVPTNNFRTIHSPYDGSAFAEIEQADRNAIEQAFENAKRYFDGYMSKMPAYKRAEILYKVAGYISSRQEELALTIASEGGKPLKDARVEAARAADTVRMTAEECTRLNGEQITMDRSPRGEGRLAFTVKQGIGPVLAISAFNHPVNLVCHQLSAAIGAGNSVLLKPASQTMVSAIKIVEMFFEAGLDKGAISLLSIGGELMNNYIGDKRIRFITFIGSSEVGWNIRKNCADGVRLQFEHGGAAIQVVDKTANIDSIISPLITSSFYHAGQVCVSTQMIYLHKEIYDDFLSKFQRAASQIKTGNPLEEDTFVGPLITHADVNRVNQWITEALDEGAELILGGKKLSDSLHEPTILANVCCDMKVCNKEVFGPLVSLIKYDNLDDVINFHNLLDFSFQTAIFTKDIDTAMYYARHVEAKACMINDHTAFRADWMPFGGAKTSGLFVEGMKYALQDMSEEKLIVIKSESL